MTRQFEVKEITKTDEEASLEKELTIVHQPEQIFFSKPQNKPPILESDQQAENDEPPLQQQQFDYNEIEITEDQMLDHAEQVFNMIADVLYH